jgi:galactose mutarotase-like enzyme
MMRERLGRDDQIGGAMPLTLEGGVRAIRLRSLGGVDTLLIVDRGLDAAHCSYRGFPLVWHGPGPIVGPHPDAITMDEFNRTFFGGLLTTCGLDAFGPPGSDADGSWGQHGHVNHYPADDVAIFTDVESEEAFVTVHGVVRQGRLFGEHLRLERTWTMSRDGSLLRLHDRVTNDGGEATPHMLLYHCNAGYPLVDEGTRVHVSASAMRARDAQAEPGLPVWDRGGPPQPGFNEQCFIHTAAPGEDGWAEASVENPRLGITLALHFRPEELPWCITWRMLGIRDYVMAIEPANCETIEGRIAARERGTLPMLGPGETREYHLEWHFR